MTINGGRKYLILLIINGINGRCYLKKLTIICVKVCANIVPSYA